MSDFPLTRHSVIEQMRSADADARRQAFGDLVEGYWKALQRYFSVHWQLPVDEAEEQNTGVPDRSVSERLALAPRPAEGAVPDLHPCVCRSIRPEQAAGGASHQARR
jgi:hypothetical protein